MSVHETIAVLDRPRANARRRTGRAGRGAGRNGQSAAGLDGRSGHLFISTAMGQHGPRVKLYLKPGRGQPSASLSIGPNPRVLASSLDDRDLARIAPKALEWVALNHEALTTFWFEGESWPIADVADFGRSLTRV